MNKVITVVGLSFGLFIIATGCSQETTTKETHQEVKESKQNNSKENNGEKEQDQEKQENQKTSSSNDKFLDQHQGYWKSEDSSTFIEVKNTSSEPLYIVHNLDGTRKEFSLQLDNSIQTENEYKGTIASTEKPETIITIDMKKSDDNLIVTTENPITFSKSNEDDYNKAVQSTKEKENQKQALDKTLQLLNGTWKSTDNGQVIKISVDNEQTGTFQWEGHDPVVFVINENKDGKVSIVYESVASPSHNMIEWRWAPSDKELVWDNFYGDTSKYERID
ncbi:hypothetical protein P4679_31560 [Priestia megaterium]|uniref:hypothetical protein n=1 Tax=Priestia megaterium TaxID=1404 RepID=UPI002E1A9255|nr:hypothetical protein [Priestia megaterium]